MLKHIALALALCLGAGSALACEEHANAAKAGKADCCATEGAKVSGGHGGGKAAATTKSAAKKEACQVKTTLNVDGMTCAGCAKKLDAGLKGVKGVEAVHVNHETGKVDVTYCSMELKDTKALEGAVAKAGFKLHAEKAAH